MLSWYVNCPFFFFRLAAKCQYKGFKAHLKFLCLKFGQGGVYWGQFISVHRLPGLKFIASFLRKTHHHPSAKIHLNSILLGQNEFYIKGGFDKKSFRFGWLRKCPGLTRRPGVKTSKNLMRLFPLDVSSISPSDNLSHHTFTLSHTITQKTLPTLLEFHFTVR